MCAIQFGRTFIQSIGQIREILVNNLSEGTRIARLLTIIIASVAGLYVIANLTEPSAAGIGVISLIFVLFFVYVGVHIAVALSLISFICVWAVRGNMDLSGKLLALSVSESILGYDVANHVFRKVRGGLGMATVGANAVFAAVTGTSIASASVFTKVAVPEMLRLGYRPRFSVGVVAGSSVLGMLIPPSLLLIIFGILAQQSIGDLFIAGIVPGIVLTGAYCCLIWLMARRFPEKVGTSEALSAGRKSVLTHIQSFQKSFPIALLIVLVLGGIYGGLFTATEAGGVGALGALILTMFKRQLTPDNLWQASLFTHDFCYRHPRFDGGLGWQFWPGCDRFTYNLHYSPNSYGYYT